MSDTDGLVLEASRLSHESIDGEVLAIDHVTGTYLSITGSGVVIWGLLVAGTSRRDLVAALRSRYEADPATIEESVDAFLAVLDGTGLLRPGEVAPSGPADPAGVDEGSVPFEPAGVVVYTDMQDLLLFDPIHEVDVSGWPNKAP